MRPAESVFRFLEACGDDTLTIHVADAEYCRTYVEGELYHVDATINSRTAVSCKYDDLLSSLFLKKNFFLATIRPVRTTSVEMMNDQYKGIVPLSFL